MFRPKLYSIRLCCTERLYLNKNRKMYDYIFFKLLPVWWDITVLSVQCTLGFSFIHRFVWSNACIQYGSLQQRIALQLCFDASFHHRSSIKFITQHRNFFIVFYTSWTLKTLGKNINISNVFRFKCAKLGRQWWWEKEMCIYWCGHKLLKCT